SEYTREGHFVPVAMPGGDKAVVEIDRMALAYLISAYGSLENVPSFPFMERIDRKRAELLERMIKSRINSPVTSSCGRLFDAVSSLLGMCTRPCYDAQGAVLLEKAAGAMDGLSEPYPYEIDSEGAVHFQPMIMRIVKDIKKGTDASSISRKFHSTLVHAALEMCTRIAHKTGLDTVVLSGGVFQNRIIFKYFVRELAKAGFEVLAHREVPPNDGGISLGQAVAALSLLNRK
ncbi:MAG: carbamoyltransferase HypF, partial [Spirochaetota bacterium]